MTSKRLTEAQAFARYEEAVARAMTAPDPVEALRGAAEDPALPPALRRALREADEDGIRMAALLVARLRFERLLRGCPEAEAWFDRDAQAFSEAGVTVVSGLALGIDAAAHVGALRGASANGSSGTRAGSTIAVVGTGIDRVYPAKNKVLTHSIAERIG